MYYYVFTITLSLLLPLLCISIYLLHIIIQTIIALYPET